ncbi:MAG: cupin domain-containing protein [Candidatus Dormiibacterota bacterium]
MTERTNERRTKLLHHTPKTSLSVRTAQSSGMRRLAGISADLSGSENIWMGEAHVSPGSRSEDHHHGESETAIYVVSGHPVFVFLNDNVESRIEAGPGDYVYVPPFVTHREENPSRDEEAVVVLARTTQEAIVVNVLLKPGN